MAKSKDEISKDLELLQYLDMKGFKKALEDNGANLPSEEEFIKAMDLHLRIIFHRYTRSQEDSTPKQLNRGDMSKEVRMFIKPPYFERLDRIFMPKPNFLSTWSKNKYNPGCEKERPKEVQEALDQYETAPRMMPFATKRDVIKEVIPVSLQHRMAGYKYVRVYFNQDGKGKFTNLATDRTDAPIIMISTASNGHFGCNDGCVEVDVDLLANSLCWLERDIVASVVYFPQDAGVIRKGTHLELIDSAGTHVIIFDRRSKKKDQEA